MTKQKSTKRALLASVLSLALCFTMLVGSTFAWFTDSATTGVNTIQAGNLDVMLMMKDGENWVDAEGKVLNFKKAGEASAEPVLFEPGATYELPTLRIDNNGNLALKFKLLVNGVSGDMKLAELLRVKISVDGAQAYDAGTLYSLMTDEDGAAYGVLKAKEKTAEYTIALHMPTSAGNEYMNMKLENMAFTVIAAQLADENDSYGNQYDKDALYPDVVTAEYDKTEDTVFEIENKLSVTIPTSTKLVDENGNEITDGTGLQLSCLNGSLPANLKIEDKLVETQTFEISLTTASGAKVVAEEGEISVVLTVGEHTGDVKLYHYDSLVENAVYADGKISFTTKTFSPFTVVKHGVLLINNLDDLKAFRDDVNNGNTYAGITVKLNADIDLENEEWAPIGYAVVTDNKYDWDNSPYFGGTFDGQGHTVSNLFINAPETNIQGFFGYGKIKEVKNVNFNNASVKGLRRSAVLVGQNDGAMNASNVTFTGDIKVEVMRNEAGTVAGRGGIGAISNVTVNANEGSYIKCSVDNNKNWEYVGGVWGHAWPSSAKNISSNIDVYAYASSTGGIGGGCAVSSENVTCSGNVTMTIKDSEIHKGAMQCWQTNGTVYGFGVGSSNKATHTNCTSTGTLTIANEVITNLGFASQTNGYSENDVRFGAPYYADGVITVKD